LGVKERVSKRGEIIEPIDKGEIKEALKKLIERGAQSIAVCYLHAYINPLHEQITADVIKSEFPALHFTLSSEVMPEIREYERTSATVMNAYVQPLTTHYLKSLKDKLNLLGFEGQLHIMDSAGRLTSVEGAANFPIQLLESGPAGGTMAGVYFGRMTGRNDLLAFDMGGTTAKASLIKNLEPEITHHFEAAREKRFKKGSGLPVRIPVIDMIEIGAGGGSIAYVNHLGLLTVGPESASSTPGPACYDRGGENPTVTDADLVLGYLNPDYFLGGTMKLNTEKAYESIKQKIALPLGISVEEAAWGIHRIVNENMANAARVHIVEKGLDPRIFSMMAFGGAGPVHAFHVARLLHCHELMIPAGAGVLSALGFLVSPVAKEEIASYISTLESIDWVKINEIIHQLTQKATSFVLNAGIQSEDARIILTTDMRYLGQGHEISVKIPIELLHPEGVAEITSLFTNEYRLKYGREIPNMPIETITWRVLASGPVSGLHATQTVISDHKEMLKSSRYAYFGNEYIEVPVYNRYQIPEGLILEGPCIVEEFESTTIIGENSNVSIDAHKNLIITLDS
jgi:N-methylhydantoinase A